MDTKHTKGQWYATEFAGRWMISDSNFYDGDDLLDSDDKGEPEAEANAKLMAAAPDLLEALQKAVEVIERMSDEFSAIAERHASYTVGESRIIEGAIKKATT